MEVRYGGLRLRRRLPSLQYPRGSGGRNEGPPLRRPNQLASPRRKKAVPSPSFSSPRPSPHLRPPRFPATGTRTDGDTDGEVHRRVRILTFTHAYTLGLGLILLVPFVALDPRANAVVAVTVAAMVPSTLCASVAHTPPLVLATATWVVREKASREVLLVSMSASSSPSLRLCLRLRFMCVCVFVCTYLCMCFVCISVCIVFVTPELLEGESSESGEESTWYLPYAPYGKTALWAFVSF